ncbi:hypothetical protein AB0O76_29885 [Streptomyces sp. NPDC086554]|uniref:hypothetical protein n=1 Tax=Streptomyces sp. NPDC086554 TaxID=3154864 RepID=UPI00342006E6
MFSTKQIAAASGLLGSLVVTFAGGAQASAAGACPVDRQGNTTCVQRTIVTPDGERFVVRQDKCTPVQPLTLPVVGLLSGGQTRLGPEVTCNPNSPNTTEAPVNPAPDNNDDIPAGLVRLLG